MSDTVTLHGYRYSVYQRVARLALHIKDVPHDLVEVNPFGDLDPAYLALHPFGRVPVLTHGPFTVFETRAITRYIDEAFPGPPLQPTSAQAVARMDQVLGIIDSYGYWPMIRQVFAQRVFRTLEGQTANEAEVASGLLASHKVLSVLDGFAGEGLVLNGSALTLADCHLAPMMDYFVRAEEGRAALSEHPALSRWWERVTNLPTMRATDPNLSEFRR